MMRQTAFEENLGVLEDFDGSRRVSRAAVRRVPYDYVAIFRLTGRRGNVVTTAINVNADARFICTSLGYSLEEPEVPPASPGIILSPTLGVSSFLRGTLRTSATSLNRGLQAEQLAALQTQNIRDNLSFRYAIVDKGSGRELQNTPIHNMAGLGRADGERPFRELAVPYVFAPNSSISIDLYEIVTIPGGTIHLDFQGYKEFV